MAGIAVEGKITQNIQDSVKGQRIGLVVPDVRWREREPRSDSLGYYIAPLFKSSRKTFRKRFDFSSSTVLTH